jgi:hypothetical protein
MKKWANELNFFKGKRPSDQKPHEEMLKRNVNQNHIKISPHSCLEWLSSRTPPATNVGKDTGKRNPHTLLVGM